MWARNTNDGNRIQAFYVDKGSKGFITSKIEKKYSLRSVHNADIKLDNCFVPDKNKLTHAKDFATGTNAILEASRLLVAWLAAGIPDPNCVFLIISLIYIFVPNLQIRNVSDKAFPFFNHI